MAIRIEQVDAGSEAEALGLAPGDELLSVDDNELNDTLDYDFYTDSSSFHLKARVADGIREWEVQRPQRGPFGCGFKTYLGDAKHSCSNHCMFCFIDQLPPGMRESLYFKDDDERLSFLFGNYITMTNMQDHEIDRIITASSHDQALCFSNFGRVYALPIYQIPEGSRTSKGKAIVNLLDIAEGESIMTILPVSRFDESHYVFLATVNGVMKKTSLKEFAVIKRMGKAAITLDDNDSILTAVITDGTQDIMVFGSNGKVLRFDENEVRPMGRTARGVLTMKLPEGHKCVSMFAVHADTNMEVLTVCANGYGKRTPLADHPKHGRRSQGQIAIMTSERNGELVSATLVNVEDTVLVLTNNGRMIRTTVESIRQSGRATQGVKLMETLDETVVSVTRVANEDAEDVSTDAESHGASALAGEATVASGELPVPSDDENGENE